MSNADRTLIDRIAETEYAAVADPEYVTRERFGRFAITPEFPDRYDGNQLFDCRAQPGEVDELLADVERLYARAPTPLPFRKVSGHDAPTFEHLTPALEGHGFRVKACLMTVHRRASAARTNADVRIEAVDGTRPDVMGEVLADVPERIGRGYAYQAAQAARLGGETFLGWLDGRPAGTTGFFIVDGVARFRYVGTAFWARGRGVAATLISHVLAHPAVRACEAVSIHVAPDGPIALYDRFGFDHVGPIWEALRAPDEDESTPEA